MLEERRKGISSELSLKKPQADVELAFVQLKSETLNRIDAALKKLAQGSYGNCVECADAISKERLRALPFAARCTGCEERREAAVRQRQAAEPRRAYVGIVSEISA